MLQSVRLRPVAIALTAVTLSVASVAGAQATAKAKAKATTKAAAAHPAGHFSVKSPDLLSNGRIALSHVYNGMGCNGQNISPALQWANAPAGTKSFAVTIYDPDAPTGSGWWHWMIYNIPATTTSLAAGAGNGRNAPAGSVAGPTDFGKKEYGGPCPPVGDKPHHYRITVFALKTDKINVPGDATSAFVGYNLNANKIATARITGLYGR
ncbi:MAG TPA: YbhB/YbcL family Raf kinase inhibitor-like protein [Gemmatimonadaceae bacterium]|nr:YbhB/YbcL family Raf kinase inhibitor-like protein [Gemmatimonadaceae bacterium]